jgi:Reverse transcriptase (RNA-dependent DNA polymerase)
MERPALMHLHACHEELAAAVLAEANTVRPFFIRPDSTIAGLPRLAPRGAELGGFATVLLLSPRASGGRARAWRLATQPDVTCAIPLPSAGGMRIRGVVPFAGVLPECAVFPPVVPEGRIAACVKSHGRLLEENGISKGQIGALARLFVALGRNTVFRGRWVGGYTRASLELAAGLAWSLVLLSAPSHGERLPGWVFPPELRGAGPSEDRGLTPDPSGLWGLSGSERVTALRRARGWDVRAVRKRVVSVDEAWNGSLFLAQIGGVPSGEPAADWREIGRRLGAALRRLDFGAMEGVEALGHLAPAWRRLVAKHRHTSIAHLIHTLKYRDLIRDGRWDRSILVPRLRAVEQPNELLPDVPLGRLGPARLLAGLRMRSAPPVEASVLADIERALFASDTPAQKPIRARRADERSPQERWAAILGAMPNPRYERRARRKSSGGVRWLDVPRPTLAGVHRLIEAALTPVFPPNTWACAFLPYRGPAWHAHIHAGASVAAVVDIQDFFGSVRPRHVERWFGLSETDDASDINLLPDWSEAGRRALIDLAFAGDGRGHHWLPQGAPTSPYFANLAATRVDILASVGGRQRFGEALRYSRYADDLVLSMGQDGPEVDPSKLVRFLRKVLRGAGWAVNETKVRRYRRSDGAPLIACGVEVPSVPGGACRLTGPMRRRVRAALHHARHLDYALDHLDEGLAADRGMLSFAYAATGDPAFLAYTSRRLREFAEAAAGVVLAEALLAGVADAIDRQTEP